MNVFNRLLLILLDLCLLVAVVAVLLVTGGLARPEQLAPTPWFADRLVPFTRLDPQPANWAVGITIGLGILGLALLALELRPAPRPAPHLALKEDGLGRVTVARDGVCRLAEREAGLVPGVMEVRAQVEEARDGLRLAARLAVDPASSLPDLTTQVQERVKAAVEHHLGRPVAGVAVDAQVAPLGGGRGVPARVR